MPPQKKDFNPCGIEGHTIASIKKGVKVLPPTQSMGAAVVEDVIVICTKCGRSLEEIRAEAVNASS